MNWHEKWKALSARIEGLIEAARFVASMGGTDDYGSIKNRIFPELKSICAELKAFHETYASSMPEGAAKTLEAWRHSGSIVTEAWNSISSLQASIASLIILRSEFEYLIQDTEVEGKSRTERAFEHLRRQITVDEDIRNKWQQAYRDGEARCEALGAVHLLSHGIWAFKVQGGKAVTDLVYTDKAVDENLVSRTATTAVLTEWKKVTSQNSTQKAAEAIKQTQEYAGGVLGDLALKNTRYVVLVSEHQLGAIGDQEISGITYRHINIPVDPLLPSKEARQKK